MDAKRTIVSIGLVMSFAWSVYPAQAAQKGRVFDPEQRWRLSATIGEVSNIDGFVQETTRRLFEVTGTVSPDNSEAYSFGELGIDSSDTTFGISLQHLWKYVTLEFNGSVMRTEAQGIATRDFFIGVQQIRFDGQDYEYQVILEGTAYDATLDAALIGVRTSFTPVTINPHGAVQLVPWIHLGLFGFTGDFEVDAGPARGIQQYELPVRDYVENGRGKGDVTAFVPEIGIGGELRFVLGERKGRRSTLALEAGYSIFEFKGSTSDLGISARNDKDLDVDYTSVNLGLFLEWPWTSGTNFVIGAELRDIEADALAEAKERSLEQTLLLREKFDKDISLEVTTVNVLLGFRW